MLSLFERNQSIRRMESLREKIAAGLLSRSAVILQLGDLRAQLRQAHDDARWSDAYALADTIAALSRYLHRGE